METRRVRLKIRNGRRWDFEEIEIPTDEEIRRLAEGLHAAQIDHSETIGKWKIRYHPCSSHDYTVISYDLLNRAATETREKGINVVPAIFEIRYGDGFNLHWSVTLAWINGDDQTPYWSRQGKRLYPPLDAKQGSLFDDTDNSEKERPAVPARSLFEGTAYHIETTLYERDAEARRQCIEHYGAQCTACGFDFGKVYGAVANCFIHVHHLIPISEIGKEYAVDPIADLRPLCPNCHSVAHLRTPPYSIEELKAFLRPHHSYN